jgi:hypothetical protein
MSNILRAMVPKRTKGSVKLGLEGLSQRECTVSLDCYPGAYRKTAKR